MQTYGYARCSTDETKQDIDRQRRELLTMGVPDENHIYWEYASGADEGRKALKELLAVLQPGDTVICTEISRLTRSTAHLCGLLEAFRDKSLCLVAGGLKIDFRASDGDPMTIGMVQMLGVFAEMERRITSERVKSGLANARAKGKKLGRPYMDAERLPKDFDRVYALYKKGTITMTDLAKLLGVTRSTAYRWVRIAHDDETKT